MVELSKYSADSAPSPTSFHHSQMMALILPPSFPLTYSVMPASSLVASRPEENIATTVAAPEAAQERTTAGAYEPPRSFRLCWIVSIASLMEVLALAMALARARSVLPPAATSKNRWADCNSCPARATCDLICVMASSCSIPITSQNSLLANPPTQQLRTLMVARRYVLYPEAYVRG